VGNCPKCGELPKDWSSQFSSDGEFCKDCNCGEQFIFENVLWGIAQNAENYPKIGVRNSVLTENFLKIGVRKVES
jgi:hypothetical protein